MVSWVRALHSPPILGVFNRTLFADSVHWSDDFIVRSGPIATAEILLDATYPDQYLLIPFKWAQK